MVKMFKNFKIRKNSPIVSIREGQQGRFIMFNRRDTLISMIKCTYETDDHPDRLLHFQSNYRLLSLTLVNWH